MHHFDFESILTGATALGIIAHAVNTFPQPQSPIAKWILGTVQYAVGQRLQAQSTMSAAPFEQKTPPTPPPTSTSAPPAA